MQSHVEKRFNEFAEHLTAQADALPERSISQVSAQVERASADIRAAAEATFAGQKEAFARTAAELAASIETALREISNLLDDEVEAPDAGDAFALIGSAPQIGMFGQNPPDPVVALPTAPASNLRALSYEQEGDDAPATIRKLATSFVRRYTLRNGDKGWPFSRIFTAEYLRGTTEIWVLDPYLAQPHQRRNLREFLDTLTTNAKPKTIHVITREVVADSGKDDKTFYDSVDRIAFQKMGAKITYTLDPDIHDRFVVLDTGIVFKLGRGLDIYKPVAGLASRESGLRQTRASEIDVFASDEAKRKLESVATE